MEINHRFEFINGAFDTEDGKLLCVQKRKYGQVMLCFKTNNSNIAFADILLYSSGRAVDADAVFDDAVRLGDEITRRWNAAEPTATPLKPSDP